MTESVLITWEMVAVAVFLVFVVGPWITPLYERYVKWVRRVVQEDTGGGSDED